jgi:hypothetical protein
MTKVNRKMISFTDQTKKSNLNQFTTITKSRGAKSEDQEEENAPKF